MTDAQDTAAAIASSADGPKRIRVEGMGESEEHLLPDQIAAAKFAENRRAAPGSSGFGLRFVKLNPPGAR